MKLGTLRVDPNGKPKTNYRTLKMCCHLIGKFPWNIFQLDYSRHAKIEGKPTADSHFSPVFDGILSGPGTPQKRPFSKISEFCQSGGCRRLVRLAVPPTSSAQINTAKWICCTKYEQWQSVFWGALSAIRHRPAVSHKVHIWTHGSGLTEQIAVR